MINFEMSDINVHTDLVDSYFINIDYTKPNAVGKYLIDFLSIGSKLKNVKEDFVYIWPINNKPQHTIDKLQIELFSNKCLKTLHYLGNSKSIDKALNLISQDINEVVLFQCRLSEVVGNRMMQAKQQNEFYLHKITGASVTIFGSFDSNNHTKQVELKAKGKAYQIELVKLSIQRIQRSGKVYHYSIYNLRSSSYFIEKSTNIHLRSHKQLISFIDYNGNRHPHHNDLPLSIISSLNSVDENESTDEWSTKFINNSIDHVVDQLTTNHSIFESLNNSRYRLAVTLGKMYFINALENFLGMSNNLPFNKLVETLEFKNDKTNESLIKRDYKLSLPRDYDVSAYKNKQIDEKSNNSTKGNGRTNNSNSQDQDSENNKRNRKLNCGFWNQITQHDFINCDHIDEVDDKLKHNSNVKSTIENLLISLGFKLLPENDSCSNDEFIKYLQYYYIVKTKVEVSPSLSFSAEISLSSDNNIVNVRERPYTIASNTLINGERSKQSVMLTNHDLRIKVINERILNSDDNLYKEACPSGQPPLCMIDSKPCINKLFNNEKSKYILFTRYIHERYVYYFKSNSLNEVPGIKIGAILAFGEHFYGENLQFSYPVTELSLEIDSTPIYQWLNEEINLETFKKWLENLFQFVLSFSEQVRSL